MDVFRKMYREFCPRNFIPCDLHLMLSTQVYVLEQNAETLVLMYFERIFRMPMTVIEREAISRELLLKGGLLERKG